MSSYLNNSRMPEPRIYSHHDLFPGKWDPRCSPQFPLGNFWPVYVGNFWCDKYPEHPTKVQEYFASKGLLVRMVFGRSEKDDPHLNYQRSQRLYDFLAYFVRQKDAEDAVNYCHREMYYGHRLNVFPGRVPLRFEPSKSVEHVILQSNKLKITETVFEIYLEAQCVDPVRIVCVVQQRKKSLLVEYASKKERNRAIRRCGVCTPRVIDASRQKQRFIEQDVQQEIRNRIRNDPSFLNMLSPDIILATFLRASRYNNFFPWRFFQKIQMPKPMTLIGKKKERERLHIEAFERALEYFGVKCGCELHAQVYTDMSKRRIDEEHAEKEAKRAKLSSADDANVKRAEASSSDDVKVKRAEPSSSDDVKLRNEVAVSKAAKGGQAPGVNLYSFSEDSYDVDLGLGNAF